MMKLKIKIKIEYSKHFRPLFGITVHKSQGITLNKSYSIYEHTKMASDMLYVALTRTSKQEYVNFCDITYYKPYTGYIYKYSYNNKSYVGCTNNVKKRQEEHKLNIRGLRTKFQRVLNEIGYDNFKFEILETIQYGEMSELFAREQYWILKCDSIRNGYNSRCNYKYIDECL